MKQNKKDYTKVCWSCGKAAMQPSPPRGFKCTACGATYIDIPKPARITELDTWVDENGMRHYHPVGIYD